MKVFVCLFVLSLVAFSHAKPFELNWSLLKAVSIKTQPLSPPMFMNCTKPDDQAEIISVTFEPADPKKGDPVTIKATFKLKENITSGSMVNVSAKFDGAPVLPSSTFDLCVLASQIGLTCPINKGVHTVEATLTIPDIAPDGDYSGQGIITDKNGKEVACGHGSYKLEG